MTVGGFELSRLLTHLRTTLLRQLPENIIHRYGINKTNATTSLVLQHRLAFTRENYLLPHLSRENNNASSTVDDAGPSFAISSSVTTTIPLLARNKDDNDDTGLTRNPRLTSPTYNYNSGEPLIHITSLLDIIDIGQINLLCNYIRHNQPKQWSRVRSFDVAPVEYIAGEMVNVNNGGNSSSNSNNGIYVDENGDIKQQQQPGGVEGGGGGNIMTGGGNDVVFLEGILQSTMPNLTSHVLQCITHAIDHVAQWSPHPYQLGIRCVECLLYEPHGQLRLHTDSESIYTVVIMLSEPITTTAENSTNVSGCDDSVGGGGDEKNNCFRGDDDGVVADDDSNNKKKKEEEEDLDYFTGGDFVIEQYKTATATSPATTKTADAKSQSTQQRQHHQQQSPSLLRASPRQGDAIIFDSNVLHGVDTILSGRRRVLVLELWPFDSADEGDLRPSRSAYSHRQILPEIFLKGGKSGVSR